MFLVHWIPIKIIEGSGINLGVVLFGILQYHCFHFNENNLQPQPPFPRLEVTYHEHWSVFLLKTVTILVVKGGRTSSH